VVRAALFALALVGCTGEIESKLTEGLPPEQAVAIEKWAKKALPVFGDPRYNCITCHDGSVAKAPAYLAGADDLMRRDTLLAYNPRVVNLGAPQSSRMLTVGDHMMLMGGPALEVIDSTACLEWIQAERLARPEIVPIRTDAIQPMICTSGNPGDPTCPINMVDLSLVGPTPVPATLTFVLQNVSGSSYYTQIKVKAGAEGVYFEHPLIESYVGGDTVPTPDPVDRMFAVVMNVPANMEMVVGSGMATIAEFSVNDPISFQFDVIEKVRPAM
jgi:hypothetical protein